MRLGKTNASLFESLVSTGLVSVFFAAGPLHASDVVGLTIPESAERGSVVFGTVTLDVPTANPAGQLVQLYSSDPSLARVPATVLVPHGGTTATFPIRTSPAGAATSVDIQAAYSLVNLSQTLLLPPLSPVRGVAGDRWADVILGKPDFGEVTPNLVTASRLFNAGGVLVDRSAHPNRLYVSDGGNSRVLGYSHLGECAGTGNPCTTRGDCGGGTCEILPGHCLSAPGQKCFASPECADGTCVINEGTLAADLILGQSDAHHSACNGDGNFQTWPARTPASASTLCLMLPDQVSTLEGGTYNNLAVDGAGNLYVPDWDNNRVLRYDSPFTTDAVADAVWGQADFAGNECNRGRGLGHPDAESICLRSPFNEGFTGGVAVDPSGNLWVTDNTNNRVLRFPNTPSGVPAPVADLVLGQADFGGSERGSDPTRMWAPQAVRVAADGTVFVADSQPGGGADLGGRILVFTPPFVSGMAASTVLGEGTLRNPTGLEIDPKTGGLWINDFSNFQLLLTRTEHPRVLFKDVEDDGGSCGGDYTGDGPTGFSPADARLVDTSLVCNSLGSIGLDDDGNVFAAAGWELHDLWRFPAPLPDPVRGRAHSADKRIAVPFQYSVPNHVDAAGLYSARGVAVFEPPGGPSQLVISDKGRLLYWNDLESLSSGKPADGWVGAVDASGRPSPRVHTPPDFTRICASRAVGGPAYLFALRGDEIDVYVLPLVTGAMPVFRIGSGVPLLGSAATVTWDNLVVEGALAATPDASQLWVADPYRHRVFRIRDPLRTGRRVDVLLGQDGADGVTCNRGVATPARNSLCHPGAVALDPSGNVYVSDHALESQGNHRLLEWDAARFPRGDAPLMGLAADRVYGTGGRFDVPGCQDRQDPLCAPWQPAFASNGAMIVGLNPYQGASRFPLIYDAPLTSADPEGSLDDFGSMAYSGTFDSRGNFYLADLNRGRVLVFWNPLALDVAVPPVTRQAPRLPPRPGDPRPVTRGGD